MCLRPSYVYHYMGPGRFYTVKDSMNQPSKKTGKKLATTAAMTTGYKTVPVPCGDCWRCRANRVNDFVGRALCEASVSDWTCTLTLTYAPRTDLADKVLTPRHFQDFIRVFRDAHRLKKRVFSNREHSIRYFVAGEYGDLKGRAHFHTVLFGKGEPPEIPHQRNTHIDQWDHGHVFCDWNADERSLRYVMKYLLKNEKGKHWHSMSKKPPLGAEFFQAKAQQAVDFEVFPSSFEYLPPGGDRGRPYLMTGATRRDYLVALLEGMASKPRRKGSLSEWVAKSIEKTQRWEFLEALSRIKAGTDLDPLTVPISALQEDLDNSRLTMEQAYGVVFNSTHKAEFEASELMQTIRRKFHEPSQQQEQGQHDAGADDPYYQNGQQPWADW